MFLKISFPIKPKNLTIKPPIEYTDYIILKKGQNLPRDIMPIQQILIRRYYFIKYANTQN